MQILHTLRRPSPGVVLGAVELIVAMGGTSYATSLVTSAAIKDARFAASLRGRGGAGHVATSDLIHVGP